MRLRDVCDRFFGTSFFASCTVFFMPCSVGCDVLLAGVVVGRLVVPTGRYAGALMRFWPYAVAPALSGR